MKKIYSLILTTLFLLFVHSALALEVTPDDPDITFEWSQNADDLPNLSGFKLYWADSEAGTYTPIKDANGADIVIPYISGTECSPTNPCTTSQPFVVSGAPGTRFVKFFKISALDKSGGESGLSEAAVDDQGNKEVWFVNPMGIPFGVKVKIQRQ